MIINSLNLGPTAARAPVGGGILQTNAGSVWGQDVGNVDVYGYRQVAYTKQGLRIVRSETVWVESTTAIGGAAAGAQTSLLYLVRQVQELAGSYGGNPVYIQWAAGGTSTATDPDDGWWILNSVTPDLDKSASGWSTIVVTATLVAVGSNPQALVYYGGALTSTFSGTPYATIGFPLGATDLPATVLSRTAGEGSVPLSSSPASSLNPLPFTPSSTIANAFQGGVHVYDTLSAGGNAPPSPPTFLNTNWVEVFGTDHNFAGDIFITNGLLGLLFPAGASYVCRVYLWSTAVATAGWAQVGDLRYLDNSSNVGVLRQMELGRVAVTDALITTRSVTSAGYYGEVTLRLSRGQYYARADFRPLSQSNTNASALQWLFNTAPKVAYNSTSASDPAVSATALTLPTDYGYTAGFTANASQPYIMGLLNLNKPNAVNGNTSTAINIGDTTGPAQNAIGHYGLFAMPYGTSSDSTQRLQAEAESGTLDSGWSSVSDGGTQVAKCASGTVTSRADLFGTAFVPQAGTYDLWVRMRVTSAAGSSNEMQIGLWDSTSSAFVSSTTYKPNQVTTGYVLYRVCTAVTPTASHNMRFRAVTVATIGTDWWVDEAFLVPKSLTTALTGPQDLWQQFGYGASVALVRT